MTTQDLLARGMEIVPLHETESGYRAGWGVRDLVTGHYRAWASDGRRKAPLHSHAAWCRFGQTAWRGTKRAAINEAEWLLEQEDPPSEPMTQREMQFWQAMPSARQVTPKFVTASTIWSFARYDPEDAD